jgi:peptide methionine sulfoxide reductase MsrB
VKFAKKAEDILRETTTEFPFMNSLSKHGRVGNMLASVTDEAIFKKNRFKNNDEDHPDDMTLLR